MTSTSTGPTRTCLSKAGGEPPVLLCVSVLFASSPHRPPACAHPNGPGRNMLRGCVPGIRLSFRTQPTHSLGRRQPLIWRRAAQHGAVLRRRQLRDVVGRGRAEQRHLPEQQGLPPAPRYPDNSPAGDRLLFRHAPSSFLPSKCRLLDWN